MQNRILVAALLLAPFAYASPISGGSCDGGGTLTEFIALGNAGCFLPHGVRIYDIDVSLPGPADLATFGFGPDTLNQSYSVANSGFYPIGAVLTVSYQSPFPKVRGDWYEFNLAGERSPSFVAFGTLGEAALLDLPTQGTFTMQAHFANDILGFRLEGIRASSLPEPSEFLPLLLVGSGLLLARRRRPSPAV